MSWRAQLEASLALVGEADSKLFLIEVADPTDLGALDPVLVQTGLPWRFVYDVSELQSTSESRFIVALCQAIDPALGDAFRRGVEQARQSPSSAAPDPA